MRETRSSGSVEGVMSNRDPYSDYASTNRAFPKGHQNIVGLGELRLEQAIKRIVDFDLQRAASCARLSHAFLEQPETRSTHASRSFPWLGHCFSHTSAAFPRCSMEA